MDFNAKIRFLNQHNTKKNSFQRHSHDCWEIVYIVAGTGYAILGEQSIPVWAHSYCLIAPGTGHTEQLDENGEILFIGFVCDRAVYPLEEGVYRESEPMNYALFQGIFREFREQNLHYERAAESLLELLLISVQRNRFPESRKQKDLDYIKAYLEQYSDQKINFRELADLSGYHYDYFRQIFKQRFGVSPQEYLIGVRLKHAKQMLCESSFSCTEIAYRCGFSTGAQMSTMFRERFGISPSEMRTSDK